VSRVKRPTRYSIGHFGDSLLAELLLYFDVIQLLWLHLHLLYISSRMLIMFSKSMQVYGLVAFYYRGVSETH